MTSTSQVSRVMFRTGMIKRVKEKGQCPCITFVAPDIPDNIIQQFKQDDYLSLADSYGDSLWGDSIQYHYLEVESASGVKKIEVFNLAILLIAHNTEETRRAFRVIYAVEKHMRTT